MTINLSLVTLIVYLLITWLMVIHYYYLLVITLKTQTGIVTDSEYMEENALEKKKKETNAELHTNTRAMYNYNLLAELYKKEKKFQKVYTTFRPNLKASPVTGKFYARHEANVNQGNPNDHYIQLLAQAKSLGPKNKFPSPKTESQRYGWHDKSFIPRNEDILLFPHIDAPEIKLDIILKENYKNEVPFSGIPFKF